MASLPSFSADSRLKPVATAVGWFAAFCICWALFAALSPSGAPFGIGLQGMLLGSANALTAAGLILIWRSNKFINFAYAAMGGAIGLAATLMFLKWDVPFPIALVIGVIGGAAVGVAVEALIIRRFERASRLVLTVVSLGVLQLLGGIEILLPRWLFNENAFVLSSFETSLSRHHVDIGPVRLTGDYFLIAAVVPAVVAALSWFLMKSRYGTAVRAASENAERARLLGIPVSRVHGAAWAIAGGLATLTFMLKAPISGSVSSAAQGPTVLLPALAAAAVARMESIPRAVAAAIALGTVDSLIRWNWASNATDVVYLLVILVALMAQSGKRSRAFESDGWQDAKSLRALSPEVLRLPEVRAIRYALLALLVAVYVTVPILAGPSQLNSFSVALVWAMVGVSLVVLTGWGGQVSLGQFAIVGAGAMMAGNLIARWNVDLFVSLACAAAVGALVALMLGVPALRIQGPFLAVVTMAFAAVLDTFLLNPQNFPSLVVDSVDRPVLFNRFRLDDERIMFWFCGAMLALLMLCAAGVRRSRSGRLLIATRDNRNAAEAMSVPSRRISLQGFMLSGVFAGVAGGIHVVLLRGASVHSYSPTMSIEVFSHATIGGLSSLWGAATGVFGLRSIQAELGQELKLLLNGVGLLVVLYFMPGGFIAIGGWLRDKVVGPIARRRGIAFGSSVWEGEDLPEAAEPTSASAVGAGQPGIAALSARNIEVSYGQLQVLFGVDFDVRPGEIVALLGTNGAGKSTLLKALCGLVSSSGEIRFESGEVVHPKPERVVASGVALMSGGKSTFPTLTVAEHLRLATWTFHRDANRVREDLERVNTLFPILHARLDQRAGDLSGGEQQQLALAQTLMLRPKVLLIDELSLGLAPSVVGQLLKVVRDLNAEGVTVVVVEQSVNVALTLAERAVFMEKGTVRFEGPTRELLDRPDILRAVFLQGAAAIEGEGDGADTDRSDPEFEVIEEGVMVDAAATDRGFGTSIDPIVNVPYEERPIVLQCRGVSKRFGGIVAVDAVDLTVRAGTIVGLVGQNGAGKTTLLDCISGFHSIDGGLLMLRGADVTQWAPWERSRGRLGRSFQQARLYPSLSVEETIAVATERVLHCRSMIADACRQPASFESEIAVADRVDELIELLNLGPVRRTVTAELSTGTRRIVELACLLAEEPAVLLLDEPSAGVAQREAEALAPLLKTIRDHTGSAMLVIEHDMPFLTGLCDEMVALDLGAVIATGAPAEVLADQRVIDCYLGTDRSAIERSGASENAEALAG